MCTRRTFASTSGAACSNHLGLGALDVAMNEVDPIERPKQVGKGHGIDGLHLRLAPVLVDDRLPVPRGRVTHREGDSSLLCVGACVTSTPI